MIAIPSVEWAVFQKLTPVEMAGVLMDGAERANGFVPQAASWP